MPKAAIEKPRETYRTFRYLGEDSFLFEVNPDNTACVTRIRLKAGERPVKALARKILVEKMDAGYCLPFVYDPSKTLLCQAVDFNAVRGITSDFEYSKDLQTEFAFQALLEETVAWKRVVRRARQQENRLVQATNKMADLTGQYRVAVR